MLVSIMKTSHTRRFNGHFPGEPGLAGCPLDNNLGVLKRVFQGRDAPPLTQPAVSNH